jgi:peroxiredoxin
MDGDLTQLPADLPVPEDDGACRHLPGRRLPSIVLTSTRGRGVDLSSLSGITVLYCYPRTGRPGEPMPAGWDEIPGARGCTPQTCAFRDHFRELRATGANAVFGLSTQDPDDQREAAERLKLPFELLSDHDLALARALELPTFNVEGMTLVKRLTLIIEDGTIRHVFYPVFPPHENAAQVLAWLDEHREASWH